MKRTNPDDSFSRESLINSSLSLRKSGTDLLSAAANGQQGSELNNKFNPFANQTQPAGNAGDSSGPGLTVTFGSYKSQSNWTQSTPSALLAGGNLILETSQGQGDLNIQDGTLLSNQGDPFESLSESFVEQFAPITRVNADGSTAAADSASAFYNLLKAGDQHTNNNIMLDVGGDLNISALEDTRHTERKDFGASITFDLNGIPTGGGISASQSQSNSSTFTNAQIKTDGELILRVGGDATIAGGNLEADHVTYAIDGKLTISSVQDQSRSESSGFGLSINNGSISGNYHSSETTRSAVNQQSGIIAHSGSSGYLNDLTLNGGYLVDEAGLAGNNSNLTLLGQFTSTDLTNHASIDSTSISASFTTTPTPPKDPASTQKAEATSHLNLPSKQSNATNSTTHSVVAGITFTDGNGAMVDTDNVRATLEGANQTLKDPAKQDLNALQVFMGTLAAVEATNQVGNLAMFKDHEDGSAAKVTLHAINGGLTHLLTGGKSADIGGAIAGAAATEALMAYAKTGNNQTDQLMASLIGGTASALSGGNFDDGAVSGGFADAFNRQLHEKEIAWIKASTQTFIDYIEERLAKFDKLSG